MQCLIRATSRTCLAALPAGTGLPTSVTAAGRPPCLASYRRLQGSLAEDCAALIRTASTGHRCCPRCRVGHKLALDLSFWKHGFGPCLVHKRGMQPQDVKLRLRNNDEAELKLSIE